MLQNAGVFNVLTCTCASRHSRVPFFDIKPSKSGPYLSVFPHFDLQMCFAPQPRAIFEHRNFQNGFANVVFCAFWFEHVLRATAACHFWTSELPKWLRECGVLCILTWTCASRHSRVPCLNIGTSKMAPRMWCFLCILTWTCASRHSRVPFFNIRTSKSAPTPSVFLAFSLPNVLFATAACHFSPVCWTATSAPAALASLLFEHQEPRIIEKTQRFATSLTFFAHVPFFYWLYTRVDLLSADLTSLLCLTPLLCFSTLHIVGS